MRVAPGPTQLSPATRRGWVLSSGVSSLHGRISTKGLGRPRRELDGRVPIGRIDQIRAGPRGPRRIRKRVSAPVSAPSGPFGAPGVYRRVARRDGTQRWPAAAESVAHRNGRRLGAGDQKPEERYAAPGPCQRRRHASRRRGMGCRTAHGWSEQSARTCSTSRLGRPVGRGERQKFKSWGARTGEGLLVRSSRAHNSCRPPAPRLGPMAVQCQDESVWARPGRGGPACPNSQWLLPGEQQHLTGGAIARPIVGLRAPAD